MTTSVAETSGRTETEPWIPSDESFGARLALVRHRMNWNVKEAAAACGISAQSWRGWEMLGHSPRDIVEVAEAIAERTGCDFYWLLRGQRIPGRQGRQSTGQILAVAGQPRAPRRGRVATQPSGPLRGSAPEPGFPRTARIPRKRAHIAA